MATKKSANSRGKKGATQASAKRSPGASSSVSAGESALLPWVVAFTLLCIVFAAMALWRYSN